MLWKMTGHPIDLFMIITCKGLNLESAFMPLGVSNSMDNKDACPGAVHCGRKAGIAHLSPLR